MRKLKVSEASGPALDWMVAKCCYPDEEINTRTGFPYLVFGRFNPSASWAQGGPIIEREKISIRNWVNVPVVHAYMNVEGADWYEGPTPLIAAMRCYVTSKLGDEVEVPEELCKP